MTSYSSQPEEYVTPPIPTFNLRMSAHLKEALVSEAKKNGRSLNGEICYRLRRSLKEDEPTWRQP